MEHCQALVGIWVFIRGPVQLAGGRLDRLDWRLQLLIRLVFLLISPLVPSILIYVDKRIDWKIRETEKELKEKFRKDEISAENCEAQLEIFKIREELFRDKAAIEKMLRNYTFVHEQ